MASQWGGLKQVPEFPVLVKNEQPPELFRKSKVTDITLLLEGKELHFAKYPLIEGSTVFTQMIENSADQSRLQLDDVAYKDMLMFLECLHPKKLEMITETTLERVVTIAHKFQHEGILARCEQYIIQQFNATRNTKDQMYAEFFFHLKIADKYSLKRALSLGLSSKQVKKAYFSSPRWLGRNGYTTNQWFCQLSSETRMTILTNRLIEAENMIDQEQPY